MGTDDRSTALKRILGAIAAALLGWLLYAAVQRGTQNTFAGLLVDVLYIACKYLLMPFAFSGLLTVMIGYISNRIRGGCDRDIAMAALMLAALAIAVFVTGPVMGDIAIIMLAAIFLAVRLIRQFMA